MVRNSRSAGTLALLSFAAYACGEPPTASRSPAAPDLPGLRPPETERISCTTSRPDPSNPGLFRYGLLNIYVPKVVVGSDRTRRNFLVYFEPRGEPADGAADCAIPNSPALVQYLEDWFARGQPITRGSRPSPRGMQLTNTLPMVVVIGYMTMGPGGGSYQCGGWPCGDSSHSDNGGGSGTIDPPPGCYPDDLTCEQPLSTADVNTFGDAIQKYTKDWSEIPDLTARRECQEMLTKFNDIWTLGNVYRGAYNTPPGTTDPNHPEHRAMFDRSTGHIHVDPLYLDSAETPSPRQEYWIRDLANDALHEAAHALGHDHTDPLSAGAWGPLYAEEYFNRLSPGTNTCLNWGAT